MLHLCRRVLGDAHEAEDCFQATFLVLARKAKSIQPREALAAWLCGVARRVALQRLCQLLSVVLAPFGRTAGCFFSVNCVVGCFLVSGASLGKKEEMAERNGNG